MITKRINISSTIMKHTCSKLEWNSLWIDLNDSSAFFVAAILDVMSTLSATLADFLLCLSVPTFCTVIVSARAFPVTWRGFASNGLAWCTTTRNSGSTAAACQLCLVNQHFYIIGVVSVFLGASTSQRGQTWLEATWLISKLWIQAPGTALCLDAFMAICFANAWILYEFLCKLALYYIRWHKND